MADDTLTRADVVVIGAGFAGLSAAVRLADAGRKVIVLEAAPRLGGRAAAFTDRETGERVDNGQHVLFGCYRETYAFLDRLGVSQDAPLQPRLSLAMAGGDGRLHHLRCPRLPAPWHLVAGLFGWSALGLRDRLAAVRIGRFVQAARRDGGAAIAAKVPSEETVTSWLCRHGQTDRLRDWLWNPLAVAALNQSPDAAGAGPFVRVLADLFGPRPEDAAVGLSRVPLDELFAAPAVRYVEARGGSVRVKTAAMVDLNPAGRLRGVRTADGLIETPAVISTVPWFAFARLWLDRPPGAIADVAAAADATRSSPIVTVNLWLDGASALPAPFVGLVNGPMHWVFDKSAIFGERAGHLSIVASGAESLVDRSNEEITRAALDQLTAALPAVRAQRVVRSVVVRERRATFSVAPGSPTRPGTLTPIEGFYLAGDWTDTGLPATIEGAVVSGHRAAEAVLAGRRV